MLTDEEIEKLPKDRETARTTGSKHYLAQRPCRRGHLPVRLASNRACPQCQKQGSRKHYLENTEAYKARARKWAEDNPEVARAKGLENGRRWQNRNREQVREICRKWQRENPEKLKESRRTSHLMRTYNITPFEYDKMLAAQNGRCDLCGKHPTGADPLVMDHCHKTKKNRGLIHRSCNLGLGYFKDSPTMIMGAAEYVIRHRVRNAQSDTP